VALIWGWSVPACSPEPSRPQKDVLAIRYQGQLNPAWVAQLMGFPEGWLDLDDNA